MQRIVRGLPADVGVLKNRGLASVERILLPWGGGIHARLGLEIAERVARATGASVHLLRVVRPDVDAEQEEESIAGTVANIVGEHNEVEYLVRENESVTGGIEAALEAGDYDLTIIGASREWSIRSVLFGSIPDVIADEADCSVLMVRRYLPDTLSIKAAEGFKRLKESIGLTTSPETGADVR
jgi:nucleotide-binding universal stress UspA family protein